MLVGKSAEVGNITAIYRVQYPILVSREIYPFSPRTRYVSIKLIYDPRDGRSAARSMFLSAVGNLDDRRACVVKSRRSEHNAIRSLGEKLGYTIYRAYA